MGVKNILKIAAVLMTLSLVSCGSMDENETSGNKKSELKFQKVYVGDGEYTIRSVFIAENGDSYCMRTSYNTFPNPEETKINDVYYSESSAYPFMFILFEDGTLKSYGNSNSR